MGCSPSKQLAKQIENQLAKQMKQMEEGVEGLGKQIQDQAAKSKQEQQATQRKLKQTKHEVTQALKKSKSILHTKPNTSPFRCCCFPVSQQRTKTLSKQNSEWLIGEVDPRIESWKHAVKSVTAGATPDPDMLRTCFNKYDADKNGSLSKQEVKLMLQEVAKAKRLVIEGDMPGEIKKMKKSTMGEVMVPALEGLLQSRIALLKKQESGEVSVMNLDAIFAKLDKNHDGEISLEEFLGQSSNALFAHERWQNFLEAAGQREAFRNAGGSGPML